MVVGATGMFPVLIREVMLVLAETTDVRVGNWPVWW